MHCVYQPGILEEGTSPFFTLSCAFCGALLVLTIGVLSGTQTIIIDVLAFNCIFLSNSLRLRKCCEDWRVGELGSEMKDCYTISIQSFHDGEDQHKGGLGIHWQPGIQKVNDEKYHIQFLAWTNSDLNLAILGCLESSRSWSVCILCVNYIFYIPISPHLWQE